MPSKSTTTLQRKIEADAVDLPGFELVVELRQLIRTEWGTPVNAGNLHFTRHEGSQRKNILPSTSCNVDSTKSQVKLL